MSKSKPEVRQEGWSTDPDSPNPIRRLSAEKQKALDALLITDFTREELETFLADAGFDITDPETQHAIDQDIEMRALTQHKGPKVLKPKDEAALIDEWYKGVGHFSGDHSPIEMRQAIQKATTREEIEKAIESAGYDMFNPLTQKSINELMRQKGLQTIVPAMVERGVQPVKRKPAIKQEGWDQELTTIGTGKITPDMQIALDKASTRSEVENIVHRGGFTIGHPATVRAIDRIMKGKKADARSEVEHAEQTHGDRGRHPVEAFDSRTLYDDLSQDQKQAIVKAITEADLVKALTDAGFDMEHPETKASIKREMKQKELSLQTDPAAHLVKTEANLKQSVSDYNAGTKEVMMPIEIKHSYFNHKRIWEDVNKDRPKHILKRKGYDLGFIPQVKDIPAIVTGSGQSMDKAGPLLHKWKGAIFASTSQASTLVYYDRPPDYIVALDPRTGLGEVSAVEQSWTKTNTVLLAHPCISPVVLHYWPNKIYYYRIMEPQTWFYTDAMAGSYDFLHSHLYLFSCSLSAQMGLAKMMGYNPIFFVGCDFGAPNNKARFTAYTWPVKSIDGFYQTKDGSYKWVTHRPTDTDIPENFHMTNTRREFVKVIGGPPVKERMIMSNNGVLTDPISVYYKRSVMCVARLDMSDMINTSTEGILAEFPQVEIEEVIEKQGRGLEDRYFTTEQKMHIYEKYLASQNTYVIRFENGSIRFAETKNDPLRDMPAFCMSMRKGLEDAGKDPDEMINIDNIMKPITKIVEEQRNDENIL